MRVSGTNTDVTPPDKLKKMLGLEMFHQQ